ncbi:MAG: hypothetical protein V1928_02240 [Parcubacteria group bacterium]
MFQKSGARWAIVIILIAVVAAILYFTYFSLFDNNSGAYQAVFLSNGQVYFGKAAHIHDDYVKLTDIYYLQLTKALQDQQPPVANSQNNQQLMLMKLGNELHGPLDKMLINRSHITFIEDLKEDSQVVKAIRQYQNK